MSNFNIVYKLNKAKLIFNEPVMSGCYVWRSNGVTLINNIHNILHKELCLLRTVRAIKCGSIIKISDYFKLYKEISDYKNVFLSVNYDYAIRPENTSVLLESLNEYKDSIIMVNSPLYRQFQTKPFLIDQRIWPASSFCLLVDKKILTNSVNSIMVCLDSFFSKMLLPHLWIEQKQGFKKFSERMYLPLMPEDSKHLTIASTLYILSDTFSEKFKMKGKIIQYGFSERLIYIYCLMQESKSCIVWPSSISPFHVAITKDLEKFIKKTELENYRFCIVKTENGKNENDFILQKSCPIFLFKKNNEIFYKLIFTKEIGKLINFKMIDYLLQKSDSAILKNNKNYFKKCLSEHNTKFLCEKCEDKLEEFSSLGNYYPEIFSNCEICGKENSSKKLLIPSNTKKSINEKLLNKK
jgi:hypothetical protein